MNIERWLKRNRLLRLFENPSLSQYKKTFMERMYDVALDGRKIPANLYVCSSHQALIQQLPEFNAIICDTHYYDIARLVTSSFYIDPTYDMQRLSYVLMADSLLCHNNPKKALSYIHKFLSGPYRSAFLAYENAIADRITNSMAFQMTFVMGHEIHHFLCEDPSNKAAQWMKPKLRELYTSHNHYAEMLNQIDLTPISHFLDQIDLLNPLLASTSEESLRKIVEAQAKAFEIQEQYSHLVDLSAVPPDERRHALANAVDNYLHGIKAPMLPIETLVTESCCDCLALMELLDVRIAEQSQIECQKLAIEAYVLSLLISDMVQAAMNAHLYAKGAGYGYVDVIFMRREKSIFYIPELLQHLYPSNCKELCSHFERVSYIADKMYSMFSEDMFAEDFCSDESILIGSPEWLAYYKELNRYMVLPV